MHVLVVLLLAGCGRIAFDRLAEDGSSDASVHDSSGTSRVSGVVTPGGWSTGDLTAEGVVDWFHWGLGGVTGRNRKVTATPRISDFVQLGTEQVVSYAGAPTNGFAWSDGTPVIMAATGEFLYVDTDQPSGDGFQIDVALGDTTPRTLSVFTGVWCARVAVTAALDDGTPPYVDTSFEVSTADSDPGRVTIDVQPATAGRTLQVTLMIDQNYCTTGDFGEIWLYAATLR